MKTIKNRKLKGSVLLTVVSVMALLIIFLSGTLVLATAANNRAHVNYSTAQTNITARTVVNTAYNAMKADKDYANAINALSLTNKSLDIPVSISSDSTNVNTLGHIESLKAEYAGTRKFYNQKKSKWEDCTIIRLTAEVSMNGIVNTSSAYIVKDPPEPPKDDSPRNGGFVTTGGAGFTSQSNLYGGSYLGLPEKTTAQGYDYLTGYSTYNGNYLSKQPFKFDNSLSLTEADTVINGNFDPGNISKIRYPGAGVGITIWGNCTFSDSSFGNIKEISSTFLNTTTDPNLKFNEIPYFYVDCELSGPVKTGPQSTVGTYQFPFNTFAGNINSTGNGISIGGDLYLMNPDKDNVITVNDATLYTWTTSVITKKGSSATSMVQGKIYSKGNLEIGANNGGGIKATGVYGEKDIKVSRALDITGDLVCGGTLTIENDKLDISGNIYCDNVISKGSVVTEYKGKTIKKKSDYTAKIYPDYAERSVILGLTELSDGSGGTISTEDSQVIMRMDQVLENAADPYKYSELPESLKTKYNSLKADSTKIYTNIEDTRKAPNTRCKSWWNDTTKKVDLQLDPAAEKGWPVIKESCILRNIKFSNGDIADYDPAVGISSSKMRAVVFDPGTSDMLVVLDNVEFDNPVNIIVDDSQGGTVYFYLEKNSKTHFENSFLTTKYMNLFMKINNGIDLDTSIAGTQNSFQIYKKSGWVLPYNADNNTNPIPYTDPSLGLSIPLSKKKYSPNANIYGGEGSELEWANFASATVNILSPHVKLTVKSVNGTNDIISNSRIYYNGDLCNNFPGNGQPFDSFGNKFKYILGSCNSMETEFSNQINMIYIPDDPPPPGGPSLTDIRNDFDILYYDEY